MTRVKSGGFPQGNGVFLLLAQARGKIVKSRRSVSNRSQVEGPSREKNENHQRRHLMARS
jgi:hypothetical protein